MKDSKLRVALDAGPDDRDRFRCFQYGREVWLSIEQIKAAVRRGDALEEWHTVPAAR